MAAINYIQRVISQTPTRLWINNPTGDDLKKALAAGAINGTSNPSYCSKLLQREPGYIRKIIDAVIKEIEDTDNAADVIYQRATSRFMSAFMPIYKQSGGSQGFVTMQDNPNRDEDHQAIIEAALRHSQVGKNYMAKIPVIESGMEAMAFLVEREIPICATECFSIAQTISMCELYERVSKKSGKSPPFFITHITGIFDEEIRAFVEKENISIEPGILHQAGCIVARKEYRLIKERGYRTTLLGGGARGTHHFTEFVGGDLHVTLNWSTTEELIKTENPVGRRIDVETPREIIEELSEKLPDFRKAYYEDGLKPSEYKNFAPLQRFRNSFLNGWAHLCEEIENRRELIS